jgi:ABC-2 type transport system ATP-binding protein
LLLAFLLKLLLFYNFALDNFMSNILLNIRNITKIYNLGRKKRKEALVDVTFDLFEGEIFSLLGVNGAGKTTLSSIIASLHPPTKGDILWQDKSIYEDLSKYRFILGFCPQQQNLDPNLTLKENLYFQGKYFGMERKKLQKRISYLLERFGLSDSKDKKVEFLSGGYKQRFLIAKAIIQEPRLVILDEPTVGLDPQVRHDLWDFIKKLKEEEKISVILTTHYLDEAEKLSDRVCVLYQGKVQIIDTPKNLKSNLKKNNLEEVFLHLLKGEKKL